MTRREFARSAIALVLVVSTRAASQTKAARLPRIALVFNGIPAAQMAGPDPASPLPRAFIHKLRDLGLSEGRNVIIERRSAEGRPERLPRIMEELVRLGVDVIICTGDPGVGAAQRATATIAIVGIIDDPLDLGLVDALNRPGRNITGIGDQSAIHGKRLQLLKEAVSGVKRVAVLGYREASDPPAGWSSELATAAGSLGVELLWSKAVVRDDLESAFATILRQRADGLYVTSTHVNSQQATRIAEFASRNLLPTTGAFREGDWLLSYDDDYSEKMRRAAVLTKKIVDGARPADLPFEQPTKYSLVINLKTARSIRVTIPQSLLLRADEVVQ